MSERKHLFPVKFVADVDPVRRTFDIVAMVDGGGTTNPVTLSLRLQCPSTTRIHDVGVQAMNVVAGRFRVAAALEAVGRVYKLFGHHRIKIVSTAFMKAGERVELVDDAEAALSFAAALAAGGAL